MATLFKTTAIIGTTQFFVLLVQIVRAKIIALLLGPEGVGVIGNTIVFLSVVENLCYLGLNTALLRYASENISQNKFESTGRLFSVAIIIHSVISSIIIVILFLLSPQINMSIYGSMAFWPIFLFVIFIIPFDILKSDFGNLFNAFNNVKLIGKLDLYSAIIGFFVTVILISLFGLSGAIASLFFNAFIMFILTYYFYNKQYSNKVLIRKSLFSMGYVVKMVKYGGINQLMIVINNFSSYLLRIFVTGRFLLEGAGIFNASMSIGSYFTMLQAPIIFYLYPRISSVYKNERETEYEINKSLRFFSVLFTPAAFVILLFSDVLINVMLSSSFLSIKTILVWIFIAKYFEIMQGIITIPLFIMEKYKVYLLLNICFNFILLVSSYFLLGAYGLTGMSIALSGAYALYLIFGIIASGIVFNFKMDKENFIIILTSIVLLIISWGSSFVALEYRFIVLSVILIWLNIFIKKSEWIDFSKIIKEKVNLYLLPK